MNYTYEQVLCNGILHNQPLSTIFVIGKKLDFIPKATEVTLLLLLSISLVIRRQHSYHTV